jgi:hypothetical protein
MFHEKEVTFKENTTQSSLTCLINELQYINKNQLFVKNI